MTIAIIGGGLSGTLTAIRLLNRATTPVTIYLIDQDRYRMHRGTAYSSQLNFQPLNVPASAMSLFPEEPLDFVSWLQQHHYPNQLPTPIAPTDFIPRIIFGDYLKDRLQQAQTQAKPGVKLQHIYDEAISVQKENGAFSVAFTDTKTMIADKVVLAFGNFPPASLPLPDESFYKSGKHFASPWSGKVLNGLKPTDAVLLIGSSLTMVDLVGSLQAQQHKGKIYVVSRNGLLPQPFCTNTPTYPPFTIPHQFRTTALALFQFIRKEIAAAEARGYTWRSVLDAMREEIPELWQAFPEAEKKRFLRHIRPYWEIHRHRMPAGSAAMLQNLIASAQLQLLPGRIKAMHENRDKVEVTLLPKAASTTITITVNRVINCTGPQTDFTKIDKPLIQQLLRDALIQPDDLRMGLKTTPDGTLLNASNVPVTGLVTLGPPRKGMLYESTALREIRKQAQELAANLLPDNSRQANLQQDALLHE